MRLLVLVALQCDIPIAHPPEGLALRFGAQLPIRCVPVDGGVQAQLARSRLLAGDVGGRGGEGTAGLVLPDFYT